MSDPIKVDDLVLQVRACCSAELNRSRVYGVPFIVTGFRRARAGCGACGFIEDVLFAKPLMVKVEWLKRIPPPKELGIVDEREEITA